MSRQRWVSGLAAVAVLAATLATFLALRSGGVEGQAGPNSTPVGTTEQSALSNEDSQRIEVALTSQDLNLTSQSLDPALRNSFLEQRSSLLPSGATAKVEAGSLAVSGNAATVNITIDGTDDATDGQWKLILTKSDDRWAIAGVRRS